MHNIFIIFLTVFSLIAATAAVLQNDDSGTHSSWRINSREVKKKDRPLRNPLNTVSKLVEFPSWDGKVVPYVVDPNLDENLRRITFGVMGEITRRTSLRFKPKWSSESKYVDIVKSPSCEATMTGPGNGIIRFQVGKNCVKHQGIMQMVLRALGIPLSQVSTILRGRRQP